MKVFEKRWVEEIRQRYGSMSKYTRPFIAFLALEPRAAGERKRIEEWFQTIPDEMKPDFLGRLRSKDEKQHFSAYYELLLRSFFQSRGLDVTLNPSLEEGKPDLLIKGIELTSPLIIEVATIFDDPDYEKESRRLNLILEKLEEIKHYFFIILSVTSSIPENVDYRKLVKFIREWLDSYDPRTTTSEKDTTYREEGLDLKLTLIPKQTLRKTSIIGGYMPPIRHVSTVQLRRAIEKKIQKYKSIKKQKLPFIVATCLHKDTFLGEEEAIQVLFGQEIYTIDLRSGETAATTRDLSGLLTHKPGLGDLAKNTRLSALLLVTSKWVIQEKNKSENRAHHLHLLRNPNAAVPLCFDPFGGYPQLVKVSETSDKYELKWLDKVTGKAFV